MTSSQHFILCFVFPPVMAALASYAVYLSEIWLELKTSLLLILMLGVAVLVMWLTRWAIRTFIPVRCPFCKGRSYEIEGRGNRFMCLVCGKDH
jgi:hypothetical protein